MNREKMHKLALFLEDLDSNRFNLSFWVSKSSLWDNAMVFTENDYLDMNICQTAGCIAGWTVALENKGKISIVDFDDDDYEDYLCGGCGEIHDSHSCEEGYAKIAIEDMSNTAAEILGLTRYEAQRLFIPDQYSIWHDYASDYGLKLQEETLFYTGIHPKHAADMVYRILNGAVTLDNHNQLGW
jgi:hypothetical protein